MSEQVVDATNPDERTTWVIPCFNEAKRLDSQAFFDFSILRRDIRLLFVNDGSRDSTEQLLQSLARRNPSRIAVLSLSANSGKAEAVREGLRRALADGADIVGYADADLATPVDELCRLVDVLRSSQARGLLAARVALLGRHIERKAGRHYLGRLFSTASSLALALPVYDTQCGAKLFRRSEALEAALSAPFLSRWVFDVELLGRLLVGAEHLETNQIVEEPLRRWRDVAGSTLGLLSMARSAIDLGRVSLDLRRRRRARGGTY